MSGGASSRGDRRGERALLDVVRGTLATKEPEDEAAAIELCGELAGLDGDGALLLRDAGGELHRVRSGDVEVIKPAPAAPGVATAP